MNTLGKCKLPAYSSIRLIHKNKMDAIAIEGSLPFTGPRVRVRVRVLQDTCKKLKGKNSYYPVTCCRILKLILRKVLIGF